MNKISPHFNFLFNNLNKIAYIFLDPIHLGRVNKKMAEFCSSSIEKLEGESVSILLTKEKFEKIKNFNKNIFKNGETKISQLELKINKQFRTIKVNTIPHHNKNGDVDYLLCLAEDITLNLAKKKKFYRNKKRYRSIFQKAPLAFIVSDQKANIIDWNDKAEEIFAWEKDELINQKLNLITDNKLSFEIHSVLKNINKKREGSKISKNITKDGRTLYCEWNTALIKDKSDQVLERISIAQDITDKIESKKRIESQKEELKYNELRTKFFANISHELKTPLNLIFSSTQLLEFKLKNFDKEDANRFSHYLNSIKNNGYRLLRLVNNLIDITKIDVNSFNLHRVNLDIVKLVKSIVKSTKDFLETSDRKFYFESEVESQIIACDPFNIERVILNLISNAVKFTSDGDEISLILAKVNNYFKISVKDTGIGIKKENQDIIFEQFRQVDQSFNKKREGSGIGLSLVKSIVEMHGGKINLDSSYGEYSCFNVFLPIELIEQSSIDYINYSADSLINKFKLEFSDLNYF